MLYRKALVCLNAMVSLATVNDCFTTFFYFWTADLIFLGGLVFNPVKMSASLWLLPSLSLMDGNIWLV